MVQEVQVRTQVLYPVLSYRDADAAIDWLVQAFGFEVIEVNHGPDGQVLHAELAYDGAIIMLGTGDATPDPGMRGLYVYVEDLDAHYERARAAGATIERELRDTPYDSREYSARDLEGNSWHFGTYRP